MKNSVIYSLVGLMVISLTGIIVLQSLWVSKAISDREEEFKNLVNAALNDLNRSIDEEEAFFFLQEELTGRDSMKLNNFKTENDESVIISNRDDIEVLINSANTDMSYDRQTDYSSMIPDSIDKKLKTLEATLDDSSGDSVVLDSINKIVTAIQVKTTKESDLNDSLVVFTEGDLNKFKNLIKVVARFVTEQTFSGELDDRISRAKLDSLLRKALQKQGIELEPEYAVFSASSQKPLVDFTTLGFDDTQKNTSFKKELFPDDRVIVKNFELFLQLDGKAGFVWSGIQLIVILCAVFTLLILLCFGYSLHFIFKQKRMSQMKNDFINNMTHELKTPLASISLAASSIQHPDVINDPEEIQRLISIIRSEERRMNEHVERVLDVAALDSKELKMNMESVEVIELIHESLEHVQLSIDAKNGNVQFAHSLESAPLHADKFHMLSAFINILDNSVKYQNGELQLKIDLSLSANNYVLRFQDNGIGMKKTAVKRAFDKFYREETGNIHTRKGFGLGLSYVKSIVEAHDGTIELTSEESKGTIVTIKLPKE